MAELQRKSTQESARQPGGERAQHRPMGLFNGVLRTLALEIGAK
jgi:hypothetical protein